MSTPEHDSKKDPQPPIEITPAMLRRAAIRLGILAFAAIGYGVTAKDALFASAGSDSMPAYYSAKDTRSPQTLDRFQRYVDPYDRSTHKALNLIVTMEPTDVPPSTQPKQQLRFGRKLQKAIETVDSARIEQTDAHQANEIGVAERLLSPSTQGALDAERINFTAVYPVVCEYTNDYTPYPLGGLDFTNTVDAMYEVHTTVWDGQPEVDIPLRFPQRSQNEDIFDVARTGLWNYVPSITNDCVRPLQ